MTFRWDYRRGRASVTQLRLTPINRTPHISLVTCRHKHFPQVVDAGLLVPLPTILCFHVVFIWCGTSRGIPAARGSRFSYVCSKRIVMRDAANSISRIARKRSELSVRNYAIVSGGPRFVTFIGFIGYVYHRR